MTTLHTYQFTAVLWQSEGHAGWWFVSLPKDMTEEIRTLYGWQEEGWGRLKASAIVEDVAWDTAIWFDRKRSTYLLPIKASIRRKAKLDLDDELRISLTV